MVLLKSIFEFFELLNETHDQRRNMESSEKRGKVAKLTNKCSECWLPVEADETLCFYHSEVRKGELERERIKQEQKAKILEQKQTPIIIETVNEYVPAVLARKAGLERERIERDWFLEYQEGFKRLKEEWVEQDPIEEPVSLAVKKDRMGFRRFGVPRDIIRMIWNFVFESERFHCILMYSDVDKPLPDLFDALLFNQNIWRTWWNKDFPDFVRDLGTNELPEWALQSTNNPWRKYYLHSRFLRMGMGRLGMWLIRQKISDIHFKDLKYGFGDWKFKDRDDTKRPPPPPEWRLSECFHDKYFADSMTEYEAALCDREVRSVSLYKAIKRYFNGLRPHWDLGPCGPVVLIWVLLKRLEILPADLIDESVSPDEGRDYYGLFYHELHISSSYGEGGARQEKVFESMLLWYMRCVQEIRPAGVTSSISYYATHYNFFSTAAGWTELCDSTEITTFTRYLRHNWAEINYFD